MNRLALLRHPAALMIVAVVLWTLYPPLINVLVERASLFQVAATAHSLAALSTLVFAGGDEGSRGRILR